MASVTGLCASDIPSVPAAVSSMKPAMVWRAPKRSSRMPIGSCISAEPRNSAAGRLLSSAADKASSLRKSGAITAGAERRNWLSMKASASGGAIHAMRPRRERRMPSLVR